MKLALTNRHVMCWDIEHEAFRSTMDTTCAGGFNMKLFGHHWTSRVLGNEQRVLNADRPQRQSQLVHTKGQWKPLSNKTKTHVGGKPNKPKHNVASISVAPAHVISVDEGGCPEHDFQALVSKLLTDQKGPEQKTFTLKNNAP